MARIILSQDVKELLIDLKKNFRVIAPVVANPDSTFSQFAFKEVTGKSNLELCYPPTVLPPTELLLPASDVLFAFDDKTSQKESFPKTLLFGLNLEDLRGLDLLTRIFSEPVKDEVFDEKRKKTVVVGVDRFSPPKDVFFDLYLMKIARGTYAGFAKTKEGQQILKSSLFKNKEIKIPRVEKKEDHTLSNKNLDGIIKNSKNHPIWAELAEKCFGCGICSYVCPLCYCFEVSDEVEFGANTETRGKRCRQWDSCMLKNFAGISNHNFREELSGRIYNWYYHKFFRMPKEYGFNGCVDCNRCVVYCPAKINYHQVLSRLIKDSKIK